MKLKTDLSDKKIKTTYEIISDLETVYRSLYEGTKKKNKRYKKAVVITKKMKRILRNILKENQ